MALFRPWSCPMFCWKFMIRFCIHTLVFNRVWIFASFSCLHAYFLMCFVCENLLYFHPVRQDFIVTLRLLFRTLLFGIVVYSCLLLPHHTLLLTFLGFTLRHNAWSNWGITWELLFVVKILKCLSCAWWRFAPVQEWFQEFGRQWGESGRSCLRGIQCEKRSSRGRIVREFSILISSIGWNTRLVPYCLFYRNFPLQIEYRLFPCLARSTLICLIITENINCSRKTGDVSRRVCSWTPPAINLDLFNSRN